MQESYVEDLANHDVPDHALATREGAAKRWFGVRHGTRKATSLAALWRAVSGPRGVGDPEHARDLFMLRTGRSVCHERRRRLM
jgi:hypothetical protein